MKTTRFAGSIETRMKAAIEGNAQMLAQCLAERLSAPEVLPDMYAIRDGRHWERDEARALAAMGRVRLEIRKALAFCSRDFVTEISYELPAPSRALVFPVAGGGRHKRRVRPQLTRRKSAP